MLCKEFSDLTPIEQSWYAGSLLHACQSDSTMFKFGKELIDMAKARGLFDGVTINPEQPKEEGA